ncbi:fumarate reductase/succinate dehydrogenase flavo protein-like protein [Mytilinidion resinicola]|uniref:Fumarate reductase/succinate dehydrogenase flavo protein-like protein n=1 Tax=Mytilinidion resinicola TaxID=574789 RepID=A0A6A6YPX7_9PEZI|nr:fumarate reductase/succinate dehydrogenase flavo protein-like protein [Mytilinidion resinicola]KAF2810609.1 fumarate reductase/succinate dehydrogenase flavo protein-like protein [Mytilinidion resinicola]
MATQYSDTYDVVVAGSGVGGLSAAITAAERGARVLVLEKLDKLGGVTALSSGVLWPGPNPLSESLGFEDTVEEAQAYMNTISRGLAKENLKLGYLATSREAIHYFTEKIGVELQVIRGVPDYYYPSVQGSKVEGRFLESKPFPGKRLGKWADKVLTSPYGPSFSYVTGTEWAASQTGQGNIVECLQRHVQEDERCGGAGLSAALVYAALQRNVEFRTSTALADLIVEGGRVAGVLVEPVTSSSGGTATTNGTANGNGNHEKAVRLQARQGVIMAMGGYDWRKDLMQAFDGLKDSSTMVPPTITGDHIVMASKVGAIPIPARLPGQSPIFVGYRVPGEVIFGHPSSRLLLAGAPHSIIVNRQGRRFANDGFYPHVVEQVTRYGSQMTHMPHWPAWLVFDQSMLDKYGLAPTYPGQPLPEGLAIQADSIKELAERTGIDPAGLSETVERYNGFCETATDPDFGRGTFPWSALMVGDYRLKNPNMAELTRAPFYAIQLVHVSLGAGTAGLQTDEHGRVLTVLGTPIPGLFAAGNSTAWQDWGGGYSSGVAGMRGMMYGYRAALHMTADGSPKL